MTKKYKKNWTEKGLTNLRLAVSKRRKGAKASIESRKKMSLSRKGKKFSTIWKLHKSQAQTGSKNHQWKGSKVSYKGLHDWISRKYGKPTLCEHCLTSFDRPRYMDWANKSGNYLRDRFDWIRLCKKCHYQFDHKTK